MWRDPDNPTDEEQDEIRRRTKAIRQGWSRNERVRRRYARINHSLPGGLYIPPIKDCNAWTVPECKVVVRVRYIADDETHFDCPYWMHDPSTQK